MREVRLYLSEFGKMIDQNGSEVFCAESGKKGWVVYGPYAKLEAGRYLARFVVDLGDAKSSRFPTICGHVDVAVRLGNVISQATLYNNRLATSPVVVLPFELAEASDSVELRVMTTGKVSLTARPPSFKKISPGESWHQPIFPSDDEPKSAFVRENFAHFQALYENGAYLWEESTGPQLSFGPIKFAISNLDDIQVANEVLFVNEYNFHCQGKSIFIDVGMNAGLTSLQAAYKPDVTAVYAFEPFEDPFRRAARNFAKNPLVARKIHPRQFGLSDVNKKLQVNVSTETTIGTSILGRDTGTPVMIEIRDAAEVLGDTIREAKGRGESVVIKIDCEGSEFAILKRLSETQLLCSVDIFMIEWHKWWSVDMDQSTLLEPLLSAGFRVFDRTIPSNLWAGMLYAVRS